MPQSASASLTPRPAEPDFRTDRVRSAAELLARRTDQYWDRLTVAVSSVASSRMLLALRAVVEKPAAANISSIELVAVSARFSLPREQAAAADA